MPDIAEPLRDYSRLTRAEIGALVQLHKAGKTQPEIALALGCSQPTVSSWLIAFQDTRDQAKFTLNAGAERLAKRILKHASVEESIDVLERIEVLAPKKQDSSSHGQVNILIGMPGQPAGATPLIDLRPLPFATNAPEQGAVTD